MDIRLEEKIRDVMQLSKPELRYLAMQMKFRGRSRATRPKLQQLIIDDMNQKIKEALAPIHKKIPSGISMKKRPKMHDMYT